MARRRMTALQRRYFGPRRRRRSRVRANRYRRPRYARNRRRTRYHYNEPRRRRRYHRNRRHRYYRNRAGGGGMALTRPQSWIAPVFAAGFGAATAAAGARMILGPGATAPMSYAVEAGVGIAGWVVLPMTRMVSRATGFAFFLGATVPIISDMVSRYLFKAIGLSAYAYETAAELAELGQEPRFPPSLSAYAYETAADLGDGDDMGDLAISPYQASYGGAMPHAPWESRGVAAGTWETVV